MKEEHLRHGQKWSQTLRLESLATSYASTELLDHLDRACRSNTTLSRVPLMVRGPINPAALRVAGCSGPTFRRTVPDAQGCAPCGGHSLPVPT
eukprot:4418799-Amphidinium_carterae.1